MNKRYAILILVFLISYTAFAATRQESVLRDGFVLAGVDGKPTKGEDNEQWLFEFDSDLSDDQSRVCAGASLELLPSSTLEKMATDMGDRTTTSYRLWGKVTKYKGKNFIYPIYFLPLSKVAKTKQATPEQSQQQQPQLTINEPDDALAIPQEIIAKLKTQKTFRPEQLQKGLELKQDCILPERTGFITEKDGKLVFELDALGKNVQKISFQLLPCQVLEHLQQTQSAEPDPVRFKIAGIVTKYKGENYLLPQRAIRAYSHENFGR
ncbi:MAG: hypothetical protein JSV82_10040 [Planctomycetota bacterium]|nr:MAG: hypothetical protein JSV82_10040 [Planctomycetota bacterium]